MIGNRNRDRHIDANHADIDIAGEITRRIAVTRENGCAIAIFVVDHQLARLLVAFRAQNRENRTKNLVTIDRHVGRHMIKQRTPDKKAVLIAL